jgi:hypothetical protein
VGLGRTFTIDNCYARGSLRDAVSGNSDLRCLAGGFIGDGWDEAIVNCWCAMSPFAAGGVYPVFGFGETSSPNHLRKGCYWDRDSSRIVLDNGGEGVMGKTTAQMKTHLTFDGWDFAGESVNGTADVWRMCTSGNDYPHLTWEHVQRGDFACPDGVGIDDLTRLAQDWLTHYPAPLMGADATGDEAVNFLDLAILAGNRVCRDEVDFGYVARLLDRWLAHDCVLGNNFCGNADIDHSGDVDFKDYATVVGNKVRLGDLRFGNVTWLADRWLKQGCNVTNNFCDSADIDRSGEVDFQDYAFLAGNWAK